MRLVPAELSMPTRPDVRAIRQQLARPPAAVGLALERAHVYPVDERAWGRVGAALG